MKRKPHLLFLLIVIALAIIAIRNISSQNIVNENTKPSQLPRLTNECPFEMLVIDIESWTSYKIHQKRRTKVAVLAEFSDLVIKSHYKETYDIIYYKDDDDRSYWKFYDNVTRIVPKMKLSTDGCFSVPEDAKKFAEFWRRSELIHCLNINMNRTEVTSSYLPIEGAIQALTKLQNLLISMDMYPFLNGGSLLGWYRECGLIPHTMDMDLAVQIEQLSPKLVEHLQSDESTFKLVRELGAISDGYELTVVPLTDWNIGIDIFFMYSEGNTSWVGAMNPSGTKFKYSYPRYDRWCAAELYGHLYWVGCNPQELLEFEYGKENWYRDHPTSNYSWFSSHFNVQEAGKWSESQIRDVYKIYSFGIIGTLKYLLRIIF